MHYFTYWAFLPTAMRTHGLPLEIISPDDIWRIFSCFEAPYYYGFKTISAADGTNIFGFLT